MKRFLWMVRSARRCLFDVRLLYALGGVIVSIGAHELVHVLMHLGDINAVHFLPSLEAIIAIDVGSTEIMSTGAEEIIAYGVMVLIQFVTIIDVFAVHDSRNKKTVEQLLFGDDTTLSDIEANRLLSIVSR